MRKTLLAVLAGALGIVLAVGLPISAGPSAVAEGPTPGPYTLYLPLVFKNTLPYSTKIVTIPVGWVYPAGRPNNVIRLLSAGHTFSEAFDPAGNHVCTACERSENLGAYMKYEAGYGTWYYISRAYVSVPVPEGTIVTASLNLTLCSTAYQYSGPLPVLRLNLGTWPDTAFPNDWRTLWGAWDDLLLGEYPVTEVQDFCTLESGKRVSIPLDVRLIRPGQNLKMVWRINDERNLVNPDERAPDVVRVGVWAARSYTCMDDCLRMSYAELEIAYLP